MKYRQALEIGDSEGIIQCTYATIYEAGGKPLFSLQRRKFEQHLDKNILDAQYSEDPNDHYDSDRNNQFADAVYTGSGKEGIIAWDYGYWLTQAETGYIDFDLPLVAASYPASSERLVPVKLLPDAVLYIEKTLLSLKPKPHYSIYKKVENGEPELVAESYGAMNEKVKEYVTYDKTTKWQAIDGYYLDITQEISPRWKRLIEKINSNSTYYIRPAAFRWFPVNTNNLEHKKENWEDIDDETKARIMNYDSVQKAKKKLDNAKALLAAAGVATII